MSYERKLESLDIEINALLKGIQSLQATAKKAAKASAAGMQTDMIVSLESITDQLSELRLASSQLAVSARFDLKSWIDEGKYVDELLELAEQQDLIIVESDGKLLCYPSVVQISSADLSISINRKKHKALRPSAVVNALKAASKAKAQFRSESFLESLAMSYDLWRTSRQLRTGTHIKLIDLHGVLTILNGPRSYSRQEFVRDIYLLDQSQITKTKNGRTLRFAASATTRGSGVLETVSQQGQIKIYSTIAFEDPHD